jgi:hypothetical protein
VYVCDDGGLVQALEAINAGALGAVNWGA